MLGNLHIFTPMPSLKGGQRYLLSSALLNRPARAIKWRTPSHCYARSTRFSPLHSPGAKTSEGLSIIQQWGWVFHIHFSGLDVIKHSGMSLHTSGEETKRGKACTFWHDMLRAQLQLDTWRDGSRSDVLRRPRLWVMKLILERREQRVGNEWPSSLTIHYFSSSTRSLSLCSASHEAKEPSCVNSLIRETLTCGSRPLFLFILVGKYFIDFCCSNRRRAELRGALCGIRLCGGFRGWVGSLWCGVCVCGDEG